MRGAGRARRGRRDVQERLPVEAGRQDGLDGRGTDTRPPRRRGRRPRPGGRAVPLGEAEDALGAAQPIERAVTEELAQ